MYEKIILYKKILIYDFYKNYDVTLFTQKTLVYYPNQNNLLLINSLDNEKISFASKQSKKEKDYRDIYDEASKCYEKKSYLEFVNCNKQWFINYNNYTKKYNELNENEWYYYYPLSKADAIKQIFSQVDFGLFDTDLAKKKDTEIGENTEYELNMTEEIE